MSPALRANLGKRTGVASGLLGALCVLGTLCFLLPDFLVTRDAMPFYTAHLGVFRAILWTAIGATFLLAAASLLLLRSKAHGMLGLVLGAVALLMGGGAAEPLAIDGDPAYALGLDYFVLELLVLGLLFIPVERLWALRRSSMYGFIAR